MLASQVVRFFPPPLLPPHNSPSFSPFFMSSPVAAFSPFFFLENIVLLQQRTFLPSLFSPFPSPPCQPGQSGPALLPPGFFSPSAGVRFMIVRPPFPPPFFPFFPRVCLRRKNIPIFLYPESPFGKHRSESLFFSSNENGNSPLPFLLCSAENGGIVPLSPLSGLPGPFPPSHVQLLQALPFLPPFPEMSALGDLFVTLHQCVGIPDPGGKQVSLVGDDISLGLFRSNDILPPPPFFFAMDEDSTSLFGHDVDPIYPRSHFFPSLFPSFLMSGSENPFFFFLPYT